MKSESRVVTIPEDSGLALEMNRCIKERALKALMECEHFQLIVMTKEGAQSMGVVGGDRSGIMAIALIKTAREVFKEELCGG